MPTLLQSNGNGVTIPIVLSDAEREVVLSMRSAQSNPRLTMLVLQYMGNAWRLYTTTTCKHLK